MSEASLFIYHSRITSQIYCIFYLLCSGLRVVLKMSSVYFHPSWGLKYYILRGVVEVHSHPLENSRQFVFLTCVDNAVKIYILYASHFLNIMSSNGRKIRELLINLIVTVQNTRAIPEANSRWRMRIAIWNADDILTKKRSTDLFHISHGNNEKYSGTTLMQNYTRKSAWRRENLIS